MRIKEMLSVLLLNGAKIEALDTDKSGVSLISGQCVLLLGMLLCCSSAFSTPVIWERVWGETFDLAVGYDTVEQKVLVYGRKQIDGDIYGFNHKAFSWTEIGGPGKEFAVARSRLYAISPDGSAVYEFLGEPGNWNRIGGQAASLFGGPFDLYATSPASGDLYQYNGAPNSWTKVGGPAKMFAAGGYGYLYGISEDGQEVFKYGGTPMKWTKIGNAAREIYATTDELFAVSPQTGDIYRYDGQPFQWTRIGGPAQMFAVGAKGNLYGISPDGTAIFQYQGHPGQWQLIGGGVDRIYAAGETLFAIRSDTKELWRYGYRLAGPPDFIVIVNDNAMAGAVADFVSWKKTIGFNMMVVTLDHIYSNYTGIDEADMIRNFLIDEFVNGVLHYVLLVGDTDVLPTRILYSHQQAKYSAYAADYYYANMMTSNWDLDGDDKWGEFKVSDTDPQDNFDPVHDIVVSRIPENNPDIVANICNNIVDFEKDTGAWKKKMLMLSGFMDSLTDGAVMSEMVESDILKPNGWTAKKLYADMEKTKSVYLGEPNTNTLTQANYLAEVGPQLQSYVLLTGHGAPGHMESFYMSNQNEGKRFIFASGSDIFGNFFSGLVFMNGCSTAPPIGDNTTGLDQLYSLCNTIGKNTRLHNGKRYLRSGAVAAIGSSAGSDYESQWDDPSDGGSSSLAYYFNQRLIGNKESVGDAFFNSMVDYVNNHTIQRGIRIFYLMGDPSLVITGIDQPPVVDHP